MSSVASVSVVKKKGITQYKGGTFRDQMRQYSYDRMGYDPKYRKAVHRAIEQRRAAKKAEKPCHD